MQRVFGTILALLVLVVAAYPFAKDGYHRYQVTRQLDRVMDDRDKAAFREWNGDALSFSRSLYERCTLQNGRGAEACDRYHLASE